MVRRLEPALGRGRRRRLDGEARELDSDALRAGLPCGSLGLRGSGLRCSCLRGLLVFLGLLAPEVVERLGCLRRRDAPRGRVAKRHGPVAGLREALVACRDEDAAAVGRLHRPAARTVDGEHTAGRGVRERRRAIVAVADLPVVVRELLTVRDPDRRAVVPDRPAGRVHETVGALGDGPGDALDRPSPVEAVDGESAAVGGVNRTLGRVVSRDGLAGRDVGDRHLRAGSPHVPARTEGIGRVRERAAVGQGLAALADGAHAVLDDALAARPRVGLGRVPEGRPAVAHADGLSRLAVHERLRVAGPDGPVLRRVVGVGRRQAQRAVVGRQRLSGRRRRDGVVAVRVVVGDVPARRRRHGVAGKAHRRAVRHERAPAVDERERAVLDRTCARESEGDAVPVGGHEAAVLARVERASARDGAERVAAVAVGLEVPQRAVAVVVREVGRAAVRVEAGVGADRMEAVVLPVALEAPAARLACGQDGVAVRGGKHAAVRGADDVDAVGNRVGLADVDRLDVLAGAGRRQQAA